MCRGISDKFSTSHQRQHYFCHALIAILLPYELVHLAILGPCESDFPAILSAFHPITFDYLPALPLVGVPSQFVPPVVVALLKP